MPPVSEVVLKVIKQERYRIPSITAYNRLEASPRSADLMRSLKAEVRDPLWMLTRQWQFGEFQGDDAGSPVSARLGGRHTKMDQVRYPGGRTEAYTDAIPLEAGIERESLRADLFLAAQMGRLFARLLRDDGMEAFLPRFITRYPLNATPDPRDTEGVQLLAATKGNLPDGFTLAGDAVTIDGGETRTRLALWLDDPANSDLGAADKMALLAAAGQIAEWQKRVYFQPGTSDGSAWLPSQLEYQAALAAPTGSTPTVLSADQYPGGHLDWYAFDQIAAGPRDPARGESLTEEVISSFVPSPITFKGMPHPRFWMMEENQTDFGTIDTTVTGLLHLLFAEFGLVYSNDWFMLPYPLTINTLCELAGIVVTDVFGEHVLIRAADAGAENNWRRWAMFHHAQRGSRWTGTSRFYLTPAVTQSLNGEPLERVLFLRDEMANMVWAVETIVPSQAGKGTNGNELAVKSVEPPPFVPAGEALIRYVVGTTVPDNWIPFLPLHLEGSDSEIRLQRARMPGAKGAMGVILTEVPAPYFVNEEEVPRAGIQVERAFQRARWLNGKTFLWLGRSKTAGEGEGLSNLAFDQIVDIPRKKEEPVP